MTTGTNAVVTIAVAIAMSACVSTSDVAPMGKDSYVVSATSHGTFGGGGTEFAEAAKTASAYCEKMGKHMIPRHTDAQTTGWGQIGATANFVFSCVTDDDPEYKRPNLQQDSQPSK